MLQPVHTRLDVLQARQALDTAKAEIPDLGRQIGQTEDTISILLGDNPHGVPLQGSLGTLSQNGVEWNETLAPQLPADLP